MTRTRKLLGLAAPFLCAGMIVGTAASILLNRPAREEMFRGRFFIDFMFIVSPYLAAGVVSYKARGNTAACVIGLFAAMSVSFFGIVLMRYFISYAGNNSVSFGMGTGMTLLYQWGVLVGTTGTGVTVMLIRKLWLLPRSDRANGVAKNGER